MVKPVTMSRTVAHPAILTLAAAVLTAIVILSFLPKTIVVLGKWNLGHAPAYATLVLCTIFAFSKVKRAPINLVLIGLAISLLGGIIELLQPLVGRSTSLVDFAYNELGIGVALIFYAIYSRLDRDIGGKRT